VNVSNSGGEAIYGVKPATSYDIQGGVYIGNVAQVACAQLSVVNSSLTNVWYPGGASGGFLTVRGTTLSTIYIHVSPNVSYISLISNTFNRANNRLVYSPPGGGANTDLTSSLPPSPAYFQLANGVIAPLQSNTPATDTAHWLAL